MGSDSHCPFHCPPMDRNQQQLPSAQGAAQLRRRASGLCTSGLCTSPTRRRHSDRNHTAHTPQNVTTTTQEEETTAPEEIVTTVAGPSHSAAYTVLKNEIESEVRTNTRTHLLSAATPYTACTVRVIIPSAGRQRSGEIAHRRYRHTLARAEAWGMDSIRRNQVPADGPANSSRGQL